MFNPKEAERLADEYHNHGLHKGEAMLRAAVERVRDLELQVKAADLAGGVMQQQYDEVADRLAAQTNDAITLTKRVRELDDKYEELLTQTNQLLKEFNAAEKVVDEVRAALPFIKRAVTEYDAQHAGNAGLILALALQEYDNAV